MRVCIDDGGGGESAGCQMLLQSGIGENSPISFSVVDFLREMRQSERQSQTPSCWCSVNTSLVSPNQLFHQLSIRSALFTTYLCV